MRFLGLLGLVLVVACLAMAASALRTRSQALVLLEDDEEFCAAPTGLHDYVASFPRASALGFTISPAARAGVKFSGRAVLSLAPGLCGPHSKWNRITRRISAQWQTNNPTSAPATRWGPLRSD